MSSKARSSRPPDPSVVNQAWFTNLQLLGFDSAAMSAQYSIPFNRDMFNLPNKKGYEVVMHFLFSKLNINMCRELFRDCWPVRDKKTETFFSRTVNRWMTDISKEEPEANLPRVVMSLFLSPGREKFCHLLFHFSSFVLKQCIKHDNGVKEREMLKRPVLTPHTVNLGRVVGKAVQCSAVRHRKRFLETAQENVIAQRQWREYASELVKDYRRLSKRIRELEHQLRDAQQKCADMGLARGSPMPPRRKSDSSEFDLKAQAIKRAQRVQKVRAMWQSVEDFTSGQSAEREVVESIFQSTANKFRIDSRDIDIKVPELLLRECEQEIQRRQVENTYEGGKINLLSLIQLWNLSLHLYIEKLHEAGVPQMELAPISTQVHTHHSHLTNAKSLRSQLSKEVIPDLQSSIDQLQATVSDTMLNYTSPANQRSVAFKFELLEPTPPISFTPGSETTPDQFSSKVTPEQDMGTPDAVGKLTDAVTKASRKTKLFEGDPSLKSPGVYSAASGYTISARVNQTRLPTRTETKPRRKVASGPSQHNHHTPTVKSSQARSEVNVGNQTAEPRRRAVSGGTALHHNGMPSRETTLEGRDLYYSSHPQNQTVLDSSVQPRSALERRSANTPRKTTTPSRHPLREASELLSHTPAKTATPRAHEILADKIADAVIRGSPFLDSYSKESGENTPRTLTPDFNLENPTEALDTEAFISRDLIGRSPHNTEITDHQNIHRSPNASLHKSHNESQEIYVVLKEVGDNDKVEITDIVAKDLDVLSEDNYAEVDNLDSSTLIPRNSHHGLKSRTDSHKLSSPREVTDLKLSPLVPISPRERQSEIPPFSLSNSFGKSPITEPQTGNIAAEVESAKSKVKSQGLTSNRLLDGSDIVTQLQIDDVKDVVSGTPTVTIDAKMPEIFKTATPTLSRSKNAGTDNSSNVYEIFSEKKNTPVTSRLKLSEDFDGDIFSISPPDLQLNETDGNLLSKLSSPVLNHFTQTLSPKESLHRSTKSARQNFKPVPADFTLSPFQMLENSPGVKLKEVFSEDSLNSEDKRTPLDTSPDLPGMRTQPKKSVKSPKHTESLNESYAPVEEGLQISSPFKTKPSESLPTSANKVSSSAMDDLISKYKRLRQATFAEVPSVKEGEKTPLNKNSTSTENVQATPRSRQGEAQTVFQKDLFSLDLEDLDLDDKENEGVQKSPERLKSNSSALNFFLDEDNSFLVPTSPLL